MIFFSSSCGISDFEFVWLSDADGARPRYAPDGKRVRIHCVAGLQCANANGTGSFTIGKWTRSVGLRQVGKDNGAWESA